jgi:exosortase/archaeosortase family protein
MKDVKTFALSAGVWSRARLLKFTRKVNRTNLARSITADESSYIHILKRSAKERYPGRMTLTELLARHQRLVVLVALVMASAGVGLLLNPPSASSAALVGLPLVAIGGAVMSLYLWPKTRKPIAVRFSVAGRIIEIMTLRGKLDALLPAFGVGIVLADILYNLRLSATPALQTEDTIALLGGSSLILYGFVPSRFSRERDFVLVFFIILNGLLVLPLLAARAYYADFERSVDFYSWIALAPQASAILSAVGVSNTLGPVAGSTAPGITFTPLNFRAPVTIVITTACSGVYSFGIFASAFLAFILTEFEVLQRRVWILMALGFLAAYVANVLRMVLIIIVGYYTDTPQTDLQNMLIAHSYAGWLIFLGWVSAFWGVLLKLLPIEPTPVHIREPILRSRHGSCLICGGALSPVIPAARCLCGGFYHIACTSSQKRCLACGESLEGIAIGVPPNTSGPEPAATGSSRRF